MRHYEMSAEYQDILMERHKDEQVEEKFLKYRNATVSGCDECRRLGLADYGCLGCGRRNDGTVDDI